MNRVDIPVENNSGIVLSAKIKIQEKKLQSQMGAIHASQIATNFSLTSSDIYKNAAFNQDIIDRKIDDKIIISELPEQLKEIKNELGELLKMGLPYREFVEYRGLLKMIDKYENKFGESFSQNAFMINDIANFSEHAVNRATSGEPESYHSITRYAHALSPVEKMAFRISTASSNVLTRIDYAADNINTSIKSGLISVGEKAINIKEDAVTLYRETKDGIKSVTLKASEKVLEKIDIARDFGAKILNKTKDVFLGFARKGLISAFAGYQLGKVLIENASDSIKDNVQQKIDTVNDFKNYLTEQAHNGYNKAHDFVNDKVDSALYAAISVKTLTQAVGIEVKSGFNRLGDALVNTKENISENKNKLMEQHSLVNKKRLTH